MIKINPNYEYKKLNTRDISVDMLYQRDLSAAKVKKIVREWNPYLVNAVKVSFRDGKYFVFDGQHTIAAVKAKHKGADCQVDCKVFYGLTRLDEMELFILQNGAATSVRTCEKFRALYNNGDPEIVSLVRLTEKAGLEVGFDGGHLAKNRIVVLSALYRSFKTLSAPAFVDMLSIIKEAWGGSSDSLSNSIIGGMTLFYQAYSGQFKRRLLIDRLKGKSPVEIVRDGKVSNAGGTKRFARVILGIYNNRATTNRLEDKL